MNVSKNQKFKKTQVARRLSIDRETVAKYWNMPPDEYAKVSQVIRKAKAAAYRDIILEWLRKYPDISSAQMYDWLKERNRLETLGFQQRSFREYVRKLREEYDIRKPELSRQYEAVEELPPGEQAQVDMGEISLETTNGRHRKVC